MWRLFPGTVCPFRLKMLSNEAYWHGIVKEMALNMLHFPTKAEHIETQWRSGLARGEGRR